MDINIKDQLKVLVELQKVDAEIHVLNTELATFPALEKAAAESFEKKKVNLKSAEEALKAAQLALKQKEGDLQSQEEKIKKLQGQLYQLKTNKEYSAMDLEIKGLKADNSLLEDEILKKMDVVEDAKKLIQTEKGQLIDEEKKFKQETDELKSKSGEIAAGLKIHNEKRGEYLPHVEKKLLIQYERLLKGRDGMALAPVVNESCGGCNLDLPPQTVNLVHLQQQLITCESCARILYWPE